MNLLISIYWCQANLLSISTITDQKGHKKATIRL